MAVLTISTSLLDIDCMSPDARSRAIDATSTEPWGPSRALMEELRAYTRTRDCADVLHVLHDALTSRGPQWRRILKALTTIAYCLREGSNEIALFATAHHTLIRHLTRFEFCDVYRLDRGAAVREEARAVAEMLQIAPEPAPEYSYGSASTSRGTRLISCMPPHPPLHMPFVSEFPAPLAFDDPEDPAYDSARLATLTSRIESSEDAWLNVYKLLFLLQISLPTASDDTIRHWMQHTHLFKRLARRRPVRSAEDVDDVRRLAAELADLFQQGKSPSDVRRRARMF